jgi:hypothetical protein
MKHNKKSKNTCLVKDDIKDINADDLKQHIEECEERYRSSFKTNSCKEIMNSYYEWRLAKKKYYELFGICKRSDSNQLVTQSDDVNDYVEEPVEDDYDSLIS